VTLTDVAPTPLYVMTKGIGQPVIILQSFGSRGEWTLRAAMMGSNFTHQGCVSAIAAGFVRIILSIFWWIVPAPISLKAALSIVIAAAVA